MSLISTSRAPINCSNPKSVYIDIFTPIPSRGTTFFCVYFLPIVIIFGVTGNIISLIILRRAANKMSSHFYLWWLAVFDVLSLLSFIPSFWAVILLRPYYYYIYGPRYPASWVEYSLMGAYVSQIRMFFTFAARTCSIYTIVLVTIERFIMVVFPLKRTKLCTIRVAKISISIMTIIAGLINIPWFFSFDTVKHPCFPLNICVRNKILMVNSLTESIVLSLIPCIIIIICNLSIIYTIRGRLKLNLLVDTFKAKKQEKDITIRLLVVSFVFFILTIPSLVVVCIQAVDQWTNDKSHLRGGEADAFAISIVLFAVNLAVNFMIYCLTGKTFRIAAWELIKCNFSEMRRYRKYLLTETTSVSSNDRHLGNQDSVLNKDSFLQKRNLIQSDV